jgi:chromosome segregation ATPase
MLTNNAVRIAQIDKQLSQLREQRENDKRERHRLRGTINALTTAKRRLSNILDQYSDFPKDYEKLHESVQTIQFRGSNRRDLESHLGRISTHLETEMNRHRKHLATIVTRILSEESQATILTVKINSLDGQISSLEGERRNLLMEG